MFPIMEKSSIVNGLLFVLLITVMAIYSAPKVWQFSEEQTEAIDLYLDGELSRRFEKAYDSEFFLRDVSIRAWANFQYFIFREGFSGVILGDDGWLYSNEEYSYPAKYDQVFANYITRITAVRDLLSEHNKRLIVVPIPMKIDIYQEHTRVTPNPGLLEIYPNLLEQLSSHNIAVVDTRPTLLSNKQQYDVFVRRDTHWTPEGARAVAGEVARMHPELVGDKQYVSEVVSEQEVTGDLRNFIKFSESLAPEFFDEELISVYETVEQADGDFSQDALFGGTDPSIALVGTSYTIMDLWNFPGFLQEALASEIVVTAFEAKGAYYAMDEFLNGELLADDSISTVIWELPVRNLTAVEEKSDNWQEAMNSLF